MAQANTLQLTVLDEFILLRIQVVCTLIRCDSLLWLLEVLVDFTHKLVSDGVFCFHINISL